MLKIDNLSIAVEGRKIVDGLNMSIPKNEIHVIMGPNGTGKSTIVNTIMGNKNYEITSGSITYNNERIDNMSTDEIAKRGVFLLAQNPIEIAGVTNAEMLRAASIDRGIKESIFEFNKRLNASCEKLGIDKDFIHHNINENMSGGEKKKNELLQVDILRPTLLLLDELDSGLDVDSLKSLSSSLMNYKNETGASILIITHHTDILEYLTPDKVYILNDGRIAMEGDLNLALKIEKVGFKGAFSVSE